MKLKLFPLLLAVGLVGTACSDDDGPTGLEATGQVRVVHLSPDAPNVDVLVDGTAVATDVPYLTASDYLTVEAGDRNLEITAAGGAASVLDESVTVAVGTQYTVLVAGELMDIALQPLVDDNTAPAAGNAKVRLIHGAPNVGLVDIWVTEPGADLAGTFPTVSNVGFGVASPYLEVPEGEYQVRIAPVGTQDIVIDTGPITLSAGQIRTGIAVEAPGGGPPFSALLLADRL